MATHSVSEHGRFSIHTFAAGDKGLRTNSHLLCSQHDSILIDAQFLPSEASDIVAQLHALRTPPISAIYITHGHPDHYFGAAVFQAAYPQARCVATAAAIADIAETFASKRAFWLPHYGEQVFPAQPPQIDLLAERPLQLAGEPIVVAELGPAEGLHDTVLWFEPLQALFVGDIAYNQEHAWMGDLNWELWRQAIDVCETRFPTAERLFPGHGAPGGRELFGETRRYLAAFAEAVRKGGDRTAIIAEVVDQFPHYGVTEFVAFGVDKWLSSTHSIAMPQSAQQPSTSGA